MKKLVVIALVGVVCTNAGAEGWARKLMTGVLGGGSKRVARDFQARFDGMPRSRVLQGETTTGGYSAYVVDESAIEFSMRVLHTPLSGKGGPTEIQVSVPADSTAKLSRVFQNGSEATIVSEGTTSTGSAVFKQDVFNLNPVTIEGKAFLPRRFYTEEIGSSTIHAFQQQMPMQGFNQQTLVVSIEGPKRIIVSETLKDLGFQQVLDFRVLPMSDGGHEVVVAGVDRFGNLNRSTYQMTQIPSPRPDNYEGKPATHSLSKQNEAFFKKGDEQEVAAFRRATFPAGNSRPQATARIELDDSVVQVTRSGNSTTAAAPAKPTTGPTQANPSALGTSN